jgi:crotonobetainyl-CoA:carnitine CoA-transferase CaiB-like acyl-CoA transferase
VSVGSDASALAGIRVLDLTRYLAGPFCTMLLGDHGADVVKIESPRGREFRAPGAARDNYFFLSSNRGKRSLVLDLGSNAGRELLLRILPRFDVIVENFRPGVMGALGLAHETLRSRFPRLVVCGISGFGADGPYRDRPGFDQIAQGMSGFMSLTGTAESGPTRAGIAIADLLAGIFAAQGILLALFERGQSGQGQIVNTSLLEAMVGVLSWGAGMHFETGAAPGPAGQHHPLASPYGRCRVGERWRNVAAGSEAIWKRLARALGHPEWLVDARFEDALARVRNRDALSREIEAALAGRSVAHWVEVLNAAGVPAGPVLDVAEVFRDPQVLVPQSGQHAGRRRGREPRFRSARR